MASVSLKVGKGTIELVQGDITHQEVDVIANAANSALSGFPETKAAPIALEVVREHLASETTIERVVFVLFSNGTYKVFEKALGKL